MNKQVVFFILFFLSLDTVSMFAEPTPETNITFTLDFEGQHGSCSIPYGLLKKYSYFMDGMFEFMEMQSNDDIPLVISLNDTLQPIFKTIKKFDLVNPLTAQECLDGLAEFFDCKEKGERWNLYDVDFDKVLSLLFVGDVLEISDLVSNVVNVLAREITMLKPEVLLVLMQCEVYSFSRLFTKLIDCFNENLFLPVVVRETERTFDGYSNWIRSAAVNFDGSKIVTASDDGEVKVWEKDDEGCWECFRIVKECNLLAWYVEFSPDGKQIVFCTENGCVNLWEENDKGYWVCLFNEHISLSRIRSAKFSSDGSQIVFANGVFVVVFKKFNGGSLVKVADVGVHSDEVVSAEFSLDGNRIVTASSDKTAKIYEKTDKKRETENGVLDVWECVATITEHSDWVRSARFHPSEDMIVTASDDTTMRVYKKVDEDWIRVARVFCGGGVNSVEWSPSGCEILTAGHDGCVRIWTQDCCDIWGCVAEFQGHIETVLSAMFSGGDGKKIVTASIDRTARVWDVSFVRHKASFCQLLFIVFVSQYKECFQNLDDGVRELFSEIWQSFPLQWQKHLQTKYSKINFEQFN